MTMSLEHDAFFKAFAKSMKREYQLKGLLEVLGAIIYDPGQPTGDVAKAIERRDFVMSVIKERRDHERTRVLISRPQRCQDRERTSEDCSGTERAGEEGSIQSHRDSTREAEEQQVGQAHQDGVDREAGEYITGRERRKRLIAQFHS